MVMDVIIKLTQSFYNGLEVKEKIQINFTLLQNQLLNKKHLKSQRRLEIIIGKRNQFSKLKFTINFLQAMAGVKNG